MENEEKGKPIKVYARIRPLNEEEVGRHEKTSVETFDDERKIKVIDEKHSQETTYYFDGVFTGEDSNEKVFQHTTRHLLTNLLNGMNCAVLTYGQTGSGKTYTLMADGCITDYAIKELFEKVGADKIHRYKITCSFVQVYLEKVYDLLGSDEKEELPVREHPKNGVYVANLSHHQVVTAADVFSLLERGKQELVTAETRMVRQSSRSHSIFQLSIERRLDLSKKKLTIANTDLGVSTPTEVPHLCVPDDIMVLEEDMVLRGKMDICDLAGSERLGKTMVEGINRSEARYINSSLLELGNVIYALSEGKRRHIPFRNSTLTRLLQECLGSRCQTSFIVCIAPSASEAYETRCSLNFGTRARTITNKERMSVNVEVDYKLLAKKLSKKIEMLENELTESKPSREFISSSIQNLSITNNIATQTALSTPGSDLCEVSSDELPIDIIKHAISVSQMLEIIIENNENLSQQHHNSDTLRSSAMMAMFTMVIQRISGIHNNISWEEYRGSLEISSVSSFVDQCLHKIEKMRNEMLIIDGRDKNDLFGETAYTISETCSDIESMLVNLLESSPIIETYLNKMKGEAEIDSMYKMMNHVLELFAADESFKGSEKKLNYTYHLLSLLQVLQIARLLLESSKIALFDSGANISSSKPFICSTSIEEGTSSDVEGTSHEDTYFSDCTSNVKPERQNEIEFIKSQSHGQRINPPLQLKLNRSHTFKVDRDFIYSQSNEDNSMLTQAGSDHTDFSLSKVNRRKSKVHSADYPRTQTKRFVMIENGSSKNISGNPIELELKNVKAELLDLEKRYDELSKNYQNTLSSKETMNDKLKKLQQDKMILMTERDYAQQQFQTLLDKQLTESKDDVKINFDNDQDYSHSTRVLYDEDELQYKLDEMKNSCELALQKKEDEIKLLEFETARLMRIIETKENYVDNNVDNNVENTAAVAEIQDDEFKQSNVELFKFTEEILDFCNVLDVVNYHDSVRKSISNIEDINQLESELFNMIESNVRYESTLMDIKYQANQIRNRNNPSTAFEDVSKPIKMNDGKKTTPKFVITYTPVHIKKKINDLKKSQRKRIEDLKKGNTEQSRSVNKEIKSCRAARVKKLLQEKLKMDQQIEKLEKDLNDKDIELRKSKKQVDLLVVELGHLDIELNGKKLNPKLNREIPALNRESTFTKKENVTETANSVNTTCVDMNFPVFENEEVEIIEIPAIQYKDLLDIVNSRTNKAPFDDDKQPVVRQGNENTEEMVPVCEFESMKLEAEMYRRRFLDIEEMYTSLKERNESNNVLVENLPLQRKNDYLEEINTALLSEIKTIKAINNDRKQKVQELRDRNTSLIEELGHAKRLTVQVQAKSDNAKIKLEKRLAKFKEKVSTLEKQSRKLQDEIFILSKANASYNKTFNDSGLAQSEDSEYLLNISN